MSRTLSPEPVRRPGGRSARVVEAVCSATLLMLAERGYEALTIAEIAERAGVHDTTIYRRWKNKAALVTEAIIQRSAAVLPPPHTGSLRGDLRALYREAIARLQTPTGRAIGEVVGSQNPSLAALRQAFWESRRAIIGELVDRARARREVPASLDPQRLLELLVGPVFFRMASGQSLTERYVDELVDRALLALGVFDDSD